MLLAAYTVYATRKMTAQITCMALLPDRKRLVRYWGMVMESLAAMEYLRSRGASKIQLRV